MHLDAYVAHAPATAQAARRFGMLGAQSAAHADRFIFGNAPSASLAGVSSISALVRESIAIVIALALVLVIGGGVGL